METLLIVLSMSNKMPRIVYVMALVSAAFGAATSLTKLFM
jgi:hypothetical protein